MSSTLSEANSTLACNGEQVTYRCRTDGSRLEWNLPQFGEVIRFTSSIPTGTALFARNTEVCGVLYSMSPFESVLTIETTRDVLSLEVICGTNGSLAVTEQYTRACE